MIYYKCTGEEGERRKDLELHSVFLVLPAKGHRES